MKPALPVLAMTLALTGAWWTHDSERSDTDGPASALHAAAGPTASPSPVAPTAGSKPPAPARHASPTAPPATPPQAGNGTAAEPPSQALDVCGIGPGVPLSMSDPHAGLMDRLPPHLGRQAVEAAREQLVQALESTGTRGRASAVLLRDQSEPGAGTAALGSLAEGSRDAAVLAWALQRCPAGGCDPELAARWADLEPDNLAAWLALADAKPAQRPWALEQASQARRFELHRPALLSTLLSALPPSLPAHVRHALVLEMLSVQAVLAPPALHTIESDCARPLAATAGLDAAGCAAMASVLQGSDTLGAAWVGLRMARGEGLPVGEFDARRQALTALQAAADTVTRVLPPLGCAAIDRLGTWVSQRAAAGEITAARHLHHSGHSGWKAGERPLPP